MPSTITDSFERVRYFSRQLITADDMRAEQAYILQKLRRHNRMLHGSGVVCGLDVAAASTSELPLRVAVSVGYALTPEGDEVCVTKTDYLDLATCGKNSGDPCLPTTSSSIVSAAAANAANREDIYVAVRYDECPSRPVRVMPAGCGCGDSACDYSRTRDGWQLACWPVSASWSPPAAPATTCSDAFSTLINCPTSPADRWVLLARVSFDAANGNKISKIDTTVRQWILSTVTIQSICCAAKSAPAPNPAPPGKVSRVDVSPTSLTIKVTEQKQLTATVTADQGVATTVTWTSSNSTVVSVTSSGVITGVGRGTATVTATSTADPSKKATVAVTVA